MIPELGHFALIIALSLAVMQSIVPLVGATRGRHELMAVAIPAARAQFVFVLVSFACLTYAFIAKDFSVEYVAINSNAELPLRYRISAVWGSHEGSLLLWALVLSGWTLAVSLFSGSLPMAFRARVLAVLGVISIGFMLFILITSNPFARLTPIPARGGDLNPLLQDIGLIIHPPMLYMGYVGMAVPFSFAIAALLEGRVDAAWTRWTRPWTTVAWVFLTAGITLGSWWAYYELGWGGWWFWDPVENASFMPWLVATALIHSLAVTEQRGAFKAWTLLLAIFGFSLSLLGTFLVRSGVLVSVHAFASDPERGVFILIFLSLVIGVALALYAWRASSVAGGGNFDMLSRETMLLVNNVLLVVACATILLGTLYPLILDALNLGKISVGPPYFNSVFVPLMLPLAVLIGIGPLCRWKKQAAGEVARKTRWLMAISVVMAVVVVSAFADPGAVGVMAGIATACWITLTMVFNFIDRVRGRSGSWRGLRNVPRAFSGMTLAHLGVAVFIVGVTASTVYSVERDVRFAPGDSVEFADYVFEFEGVVQLPGANYTAQRGTFQVKRRGSTVATLEPEKRFYRSQPQPMTEAAIDADLSRDLYVALGESLGDGAWSARVYYKPFQRWIWYGPLLMVLGGLVAVSDRRYRALLSREEAVDTDDYPLPLTSGSPR